MSGGASGSAPRSVEIIREDGTICRLPDLPVDRSSHSQSGWVICGGANDASTTCTTLTVDAAWIISHHLTVKRQDHIMWKTGGGDIVLIGGTDAAAKSSTEKLSTTYTTSISSFALAFERRYGVTN